MTTIADLVTALRNFEEQPAPHSEMFDGQRYVTATDEIADMLCELLITAKGGCNLTNHRALKDAGYRVFPGEVDSFGWLTGCVSTQHGIIVYG